MVFRYIRKLYCVCRKFGSSVESIRLQAELFFSTPVLSFFGPADTETVELLKRAIRTFRGGSGFGVIGPVREYHEQTCLNIEPRLRRCLAQRKVRRRGAECTSDMWFAAQPDSALLGSAYCLGRRMELWALGLRRCATRFGLSMKAGPSLPQFSRVEDA